MCKVLLIIDLQEVQEENSIGCGRVIGSQAKVYFKLGARTAYLKQLLSTNRGSSPLVTDVEIADVIDYVR